MKKHSLFTILILMITVAVTGCDNMRDGNRFKPYEESSFFEDGNSSRPLVNGTVAHGYLREDTTFYQGKVGENFVAQNPMLEKIDEKMLVKRGADRYNIYCIVCHGPTGLGDGLVVERGFNKPPSFYDERLLSKEDGYYYNVIANGYGVMANYAKELTPEDRWAVVAYIRWLQTIKPKQE